MKVFAVGALVALAMLMAQMAPAAHAQAAVAQPVLPPNLEEALPQARLAGRGRLDVWGFQIYNASLWVAPGFQPAAFQDHVFALDLEYLRNFSRDEIAKRSLKEMRRLRSIPAEEAAQWEAQLRDALPDVKAGDRLTGLHRPREGVSFHFNGKPFKAISDPELARLFFGIWLSEATSQPALRRDLTSLAKP